MPSVTRSVDNPLSTVSIQEIDPDTGVAIGSPTSPTVTNGSWTSTLAAGEYLVTETATHGGHRWTYPLTVPGSGSAAVNEGRAPAKHLVVRGTRETPEPELDLEGAAPGDVVTLDAEADDLVPAPPSGGGSEIALDDRRASGFASLGPLAVPDGVDVIAPLASLSLAPDWCDLSGGNMRLLEEGVYVIQPTVQWGDTGNDVRKVLVSASDSKDVENYAPPGPLALLAATGVVVVTEFWNGNLPIPLAVKVYQNSGGAKELSSVSLYVVKLA
jgi:hypothetical protein